MDVRCKRCHAPIPAEDINLDQMVAKCRQCNAVFGFGDQVAPADGWQPPARLDVPLPEKMTIEQTGDGLAIRRRWFGLQYIFLAAFALFWNGFLCVWIGMALASGAGPMAAFSVLHVAIGLFIAYTAIAGFVNISTITANYDSISVRHGPLPWLGNQRLPAGDIRQLFCRERVTRGRNSTSVRYAVYAMRADGSDTKLIDGLETPEQALFLEQEIERFLKIVNQPVRGEMLA